jgi:hypothetical protein
VEKGEIMSQDSNLPDNVRGSISIGNAKSIGEQPAMLSNLAFANLIANTNLSQQNALSNQQAMNQLAITVTSKAVNKISDLSPMEAVAATKLDTTNDIAQQLANLMASLQAFSPKVDG